MGGTRNGPLYILADFVGGVMFLSHALQENHLRRSYLCKREKLCDPLACNVVNFVYRAGNLSVVVNLDGFRGGLVIFPPLD